MHAFEVRSLVDRIEAVWTRKLLGLASTAEMRELELTPEDGGPSAGTRPSALLRDGAGRRFLFKAAEPRLVAGEVFAFAVRRLGARPTVPTVARTVDVPGVGRSDGMLQPLLAHEEGRLEPDASLWSEVQREAMLREHPWEWLLANLDTHVDQYVFVGPERYPLNIDWDHSLFDLDITALDRFTKRMPAIAPVRNALYDAYVHDRVDLEFAGLHREARRIARLDDRALARLLDQYAAALDLAPDEAAQMRQRFFTRKRRLGRTFDEFVAALRAERRARRSSSAGSPRMLRMRLVHGIQDAWQRLVITHLHDRVLCPVFRVYRRLLAYELKSQNGPAS